MNIELLEHAVINELRRDINGGDLQALSELITFLIIDESS